MTSGMARHHREILRAAFRSSGFLLRGLQCVYRTRSGTRPGDSIADTLFALVLAEAMQHLRGRLAAADLLQDAEGNAPAFPVWADDSVLPFAFETADGLHEALPVVASMVHGTFAARAMSLNYGAGKTEALLRLTGAGSTRLRRQLLGRARAVPFADDQGRSHELRLCQRYTHLGTVLTETGAPRADFRAKLAKAKQAVHPLASAILRNPQIAWDARRHVLESIGISAATHNIGVWHHCTADEASVWDSGVVDLYKLLLPADGHTGHPAFPCMPSVAGATGFPSPAMLLVKQRLLHLCRIVEQQRALLWAYLAGIDEASPSSWLQCVREDLQLVASFTGPFESDVPPRGDGPDADALFVWVSEHCRAIRRKARAACTAQSEGLWQFARFQHSARELGMRPMPAPPNAPGTWACHLCSFTGSSYSALGAHLHTAHQHKCHVRAYVTGSTCRICLTQFWTPGRLSRHLAYSGTPCFLKLLSTTAPGEIPALPDDGQLSKLPAVRLQGPLRRPVPLDVGSLAAMLSEEAPAFAQLLLPSIRRFAPELEALAATNAFLFSGGTLALRGCHNRYPVGRLLIRNFLQ